MHRIPFLTEWRLREVIFQLEILRFIELQQLQKGFGKPVSTYDERKYIYWCDPRTPINRGKLGSSQPWRYKKEKGFYD